MLEFLMNAAKKGKLAHGYLFWGGDYQEMKNTAFGLADFLKTNPFDILYIVPGEDKKPAYRQAGIISIDQIRKARKHLSFSSYNSVYKFAIIDRAETMNSEAANALLKTLEEPLGNTILILITSKPEILPKTILSRLQEIRFRPVSLNEIYKNFLNKEYINLLQKPLNDVFKVIEQISKASLAARFDESKTRRESRREETEIIPLLDCWLFFFRDLLINKSATNQQRDKFVKILKEIQKTKDLISTTNINQRLALENLFLCINNY